ncbi:biotin transporter BioY [Lachnoclostridium sp. Marseille-P6806]|uniref:biotin transporter BioY n=1 Tax=Lachnoclostridium sp. Marseille-P6806 TaxID=2364793 RepID=UPI00102F9817|nr:biotin transporter BioY [Lachnoclostridium sp. Marseille-P6806]
MNRRTRFITTTALMTAVICILGPLSVPIGPVPISLTNLAIYITMYILGTKRGSIAYLLYLLLGLVGLPVFSGFTGGPGKLFGPTGGYLIGFLPMAFLIGRFLERHGRNVVLSVVVMEAATWLPYLLGTAWLSYSVHMSFAAALAAGVLPFLLVDLIKIVLSALLGPVLKRRLAPFTALEQSGS